MPGYQVGGIYQFLALCVYQLLETGGCNCVCVRVGFSFLCAQWFYINQSPIMMGITNMAYPPCLLFVCSACKQVHGSVWKCMEAHGNAWKCMEVHRSVGKCMEGYRSSLKCTEEHGSVGKCMEVHGSAWKCRERHGRVWKSMDVYGSAWCIEVHENTCILSTLSICVSEATVIFSTVLMLSMEWTCSGVSV